MIYIKKQQYSLWVILALFIFFTSCQGSKEENPLPEAQYLVSAELIREVSQQELSALLLAAGAFDPALAELAGFALLTRYNVKVYRVVYKTKDLEGNEIQASGAMLIPQVSEPLPITSQQHGTITSDVLAPSNYGQQSEVFTFGTVLASSGYIISAPDYLGYGASNNIQHPYEHSNSLASASFDMLRAVKEYCERNNIALNNQLFLAGYSEGGTATMALHKYIESNFSDEFTVTASMPGAGAYNKTRFASYIFSQNQDLNFISNYLWVMYTYDNVYKLNRPTTAYYNEPFASQFALVDDPMDYVGISLSSRNPQDIFITDFRNAVLNNTDAEFLQVLADNDLYNWTPKAPVRLVHGDADDFVPIFNSEDALEFMQSQGVNVELVKLEGKDHFTGVIDYTLFVYQFMESFR